MPRPNKVVAVNRATAQLSKLQNEENQFFTGVAAFGFNFAKDLAHVVVTVNDINDPAAAPLLTTYVKASGDVVNLINHSDPLGAAREEVNVQSPASYALVAELRPLRGGPGDATRRTRRTARGPSPRPWTWARCCCWS